MERAPARLLEKLSEQEAVEAGQREPLRAAGCSRDDVDVLGAQTSAPDQGERVRARTKRER